jgi:class 3 adenylate cyclase
MSGVSLPRGTVTFLFSDIEGSTDLLRRVGDDVFAVIRADHHRLLRDGFAVHGGKEIDTAGDGFFVAFHSARSAVAAAVPAQLALAGFTWPADAEVRVRMGLHTSTSPCMCTNSWTPLADAGPSTLVDEARAELR